MAPPHAFVTLVTSDSYLPGALVLRAALGDVEHESTVEFHTVCIVTPETVDVKTTKELRRVFDVVIGVEAIHHEAMASNLNLLGRPDLDLVLTKLHVFRLTQYEKVIFLDADVLPLRPLSHLFHLPHSFAAVPDVGWPDIFNSGVMVLQPGDDKFNEIMSIVHSKGSWDGGDQGVLNEWRGDDWHRLSFIYNTTPTSAYTYAPAYERFGANISNIHFIGPKKPWASIPYRAPIPHPSSSSLQSYNYSSLVDRWFAVYDRHYRPVGPPQLEPEQAYQVPRYKPAWHETHVQDGAPHGGLGLADLQAMAIHGVAALPASQPPAVGATQGEYRSLPLDGRIDLMRPVKAEVADGDATPKFGSLSLDPGPTHPSHQPPAHQDYSHYQQHQPQHFQHQPQHPTTSEEYQQQFQQYQVQQQIYLQQQQLLREKSEPRSPGALLSPPSPSLPSFEAQHHPQPQVIQAPHHHLPPGPPPSGPAVVHSPRPVVYHNQKPRLLIPPGHEPTALLPHAQRQPHTQPNQPPPLVQDHRQQPFYPGVYHPPQEQHHAKQEQPRSPQGQYYFPKEQRRASQDQPQALRGQYHSAQDQQHPSQEQHLSAPSHNSPVHHVHQFSPGAHHSPPHFQHSPAAEQYYTPPQSPPRPPSPPLITWDPAREPPPSNPPSVVGLTLDSYYPNQWDLPRTPSHQRHHETGPRQEPESFFEPPPTPFIPHRLVQEGHYTAVTSSGSHPQPDRSKISAVFPWETKPRQPPGRVFPHSSTPPPILPILPAAPATAVVGPAPPTYTSPTLSPQHTGSGGGGGGGGGVLGMTYSNAWDAVPSIQRYAARLVRPPLPPPLVMGGWRQPEGFRSWEERIEASSRDGDDEEDEDEDEDGEAAADKRSDAGSLFSDRTLATRSAVRSSGGSSSGRRTPPSSVKGSRSPGVLSMPPKGKEYRDQAVQTTPIQTKSQAVQVSIGTMPEQPRLQQRVHHQARLKSVTKSSSAQAYPFPPQDESPVPSGMVSPRMHDPLSNAAGGSPRISTFRSFSGELGTRSPPSALASPTSPLAPPIKRPAGRTWDPARGVEVFKKGSEEVLARFLRMGSWDDQSHSNRDPGTPLATTPIA